ncbi:Microtubule-binding_calmodulin-regulated spectrin-associated domain-containing protein [Hexamita inflata]|uniref:Microtubule-binding calmodulin-regulated spectrin-associated domain-containing protein n=1 Tax=Hexamita inflata TaxID=28002 RepID=A0AA86QQN9_9EUKA|nr:Microtubule-binding calmodulin-regulated spectrin-associated domain-containing protein [Hexamita inflata]
MRRNQAERKQGESLVFDKMELMQTIGVLKAPDDQFDDRIATLLGKIEQIEQRRSPVKSSRNEPCETEVQVFSAKQNNDFALRDNVVNPQLFETTDNLFTRQPPSSVEFLGKNRVQFIDQSDQRMSQQLNQGGQTNGLNNGQRTSEHNCDCLEEIQRLNQLNSDLNSELETLTNDFADKLQQMQNLNESNLKTQNVLKQNLQNKQETINKLNNELDNAKSQLIEQDNQINKQNNQIKQLQAQIQFATKTSESEKIKMELAQVKRELVKCQSELSIYKIQQDKERQAQNERSGSEMMIKEEQNQIAKRQEVERKRNEENERIQREENERVQREQEEEEERQLEQEIAEQEQMEQLNREEERIQQQNERIQKQIEMQKKIEMQKRNQQEDVINCKTQDSIHETVARKPIDVIEHKTLPRPKKSQIPVDDDEDIYLAVQQSIPQNTTKNIVNNVQNNNIKTNNINVNVNQRDSMDIDELVIQNISSVKPQKKETVLTNEEQELINKLKKEMEFDVNNEEQTEMQSPQHYPTNQILIAKPNLISSTKSKWNQIDDEIVPSKLDGSGYIRTPNVKVNKEHKKTPHVEPDANKSRMDDYSFAFDVELKKTPMKLATEKQNEFVNNQKQRAKSAKMDAVERYEYVQNQAQKIQETQKTLTQQRKAEQIKHMSNTNVTQDVYVPQYIPKPSFDNSNIIKQILTNSVLKGEANYEKRATAIEDIGISQGHFLIVLKDVEKMSYHSVVRIDEHGNVIKVSGPENMPAVLSQKLLEKLLKYNTTAKRLDEVPMKALNAQISSVTLAVKRKGK